MIKKVALRDKINRTLGVSNTMTYSARHPGITLLLALSAILFSVSSHCADVTFSPANELLFNSDHLANISQTSTLVYDFVKDSSLDEGFSDTVEAKIVEGSSQGVKNVALTFFTGDRRRYVPTGIRCARKSHHHGVPAI